MPILNAVNVNAESEFDEGIGTFRISKCVQDCF